MTIIKYKWKKKEQTKNINEKKIQGNENTYMKQLGNWNFSAPLSNFWKEDEV